MYVNEQEWRTSVCFLLNTHWLPFLSVFLLGPGKDNPEGLIVLRRPFFVSNRPELAEKACFDPCARVKVSRSLWAEGSVGPSSYEPDFVGKWSFQLLYGHPQ